MELEEFRALEKEILSSAPAGSDGGGSVPRPASAAAPPAAAAALASSARQERRQREEMGQEGRERRGKGEEWQPQQSSTPRSNGGTVSRAARGGWDLGNYAGNHLATEAQALLAGMAAGAGHGGAARLAAEATIALEMGGPLGALDFGDSSEWVDAEFSFCEIAGAGAGHPQQPQLQSRSAGPPHRAQQAAKGAADAAARGAHGADTSFSPNGGKEGPAIAQPFVRSLYQQAQSGRPPGPAKAAAAATAAGGAARRPATAGARSTGPAAAGGASGCTGELSAEELGAMSFEEVCERLMAHVERSAAAAKERAALAQMRARPEWTCSLCVCPPLGGLSCLAS